MTHEAWHWFGTLKAWNLRLCALPLFFQSGSSTWEHQESCSGPCLRLTLNPSWDGSLQFWKQNVGVSLFRRWVITLESASSLETVDHYQSIDDTHHPLTDAWLWMRLARSIRRCREDAAGEWCDCDHWRIAATQQNNRNNIWSSTRVHKRDDTKRRCWEHHLLCQGPGSFSDEDSQVIDTCDMSMYEVCLFKFARASFASIASGKNSFCVFTKVYCFLNATIMFL